MFNITESDLWDLGPVSFRTASSINQVTAFIKKRIDIGSFYFDVTSRASNQYKRFAQNYYELPNGKRLNGLKSIQRWHQDISGMTPYIGLWSDCFPTQIKRPKGSQIYDLEPNHLYIVDNYRWKHRTHPDYDPFKVERKFVRLIFFD